MAAILVEINSLRRMQLRPGKRAVSRQVLTLGNSPRSNAFAVLTPDDTKFKSVTFDYRAESRGALESDALQRRGSPPTVPMENASRFTVLWRRLSPSARVLVAVHFHPISEQMVIRRKASVSRSVVFMSL
jgi:hypothetical protein